MERSHEPAQRAGAADRVPGAGLDGPAAPGPHCYVSLADPQPPKSDAQWEGHATGAIYECYSPGIVGTRYLLVRNFSCGPGGTT